MPILAMAVGKLFIMVMLALAVGCATVEDEQSLDVTEDDMAADTELETIVMDDKADGALSYLAVARMVKTAGISCTSGERIALSTAIAFAESSFRPWITNTVGNSKGTDRGLFQLNSYWHSEVSDTCAFSASCNTRATMRISKQATKWSEWWSYNNGKHLPYMSKARGAQASVCAE